MPLAVQLLRGRLGGGACARLKVAEHAAHLDGGAFLDGEIDDAAGHRGIHLNRDLVGFELAQWLVDCHRITQLYQPLGDGRLGDRFTQCRNLDLDGHD